MMRPEEDVLAYLALENDERVWYVAGVVKTARALGIPDITDTKEYALIPMGIKI